MGCSPSLARRVCLAAIATGLASIIVSILGSDLLHVLVITQIQPWRWLWLANAVAVLLLPVIAADRWRGGDADRACFLLIVASWLSYEQTFTLIVSALALTAASIRNRSLDPRQVRRLFIGSVVVLAIVALVVAGWVANIVLKQLALPASATLHPSAFGLFSYRLIPYTADGILPVGVFTLIWWFAMHRSERRAGPVVLLVGCVLLGITAPAAWGTWSDPAPSREYRAKFAAWRQQIPETAQVLAPGVPLIPWFLLDRASYWSVRQMAGIAFSRPTAMEFFRRMAILSGMPPARTGAEALKHMCTSDPLIEFVVSRADLGPTRFAPIASDSAGGSTWLYLYRCADQRSQSGAGTSQAPQTQE